LEDFLGDHMSKFLDLSLLDKMESLDD
jgi:hypothetical protein